MKKIITAAALILSSLTAQAEVNLDEALNILYNDNRVTLTEVKAIQDTAHKNFTYVDEAVDSWDVYNVNYKFNGDCDDWALSMKAAVGAGSVYYSFDTSGNAHAVYIYKGHIFEMNNEMIGVDDYMRNGGKIFWDMEMTADMGNIEGLIAKI